MDNVPFHKSTSIRQFIENLGNRLLLLPPYSPFLNLIENMFSKWKQHIRQARPENEAVLFKLIEDGSRLIKPSDCASHYKHMITFLTMCINKQEIVNE